MTIGIDLGTTFSLAAFVDHDGTAKIIPDATFKQYQQTPSSVLLSQEGAALVGWQAEGFEQTGNKAYLQRFFKRNFGQEDAFTYDTAGNAWSAEALGALVLRKLAHEAEIITGQRLTGAVITVPAHFNELQRSAVIYAADMAGLNLLGIIDEPTAAAIHYAMTNDDSDEKIYLVYDFGGGTFDVSILTQSRQQSTAQVIAKDGDATLGGKELDEAIMEMILEEMEMQGHSIDLPTVYLLQLRRVAEEVKIAFSEPDAFFVNKRIAVGSFNSDVFFDRDIFEVKIKKNILKTIEICKRCIREAGLTIDNIDNVLLVGGSSLTYCVRQLLVQELAIPAAKIKFHEPIFSVALGAALRATQINGVTDALLHQLPMEFQGVTGFHTAIKVFNSNTQGEELDKLITKNNPLPAKALRKYYLSSEKQQFITFPLVQYFDNPDDAFLIGKVQIGPIEKPKPNYCIEIELEINKNGVVSIKAYDAQTGRVEQQSFINHIKDTAEKLAQKQRVQKTIIN